MRIVVLGATGMLGNTLLRLFHLQPDLEVIGTARTRSAKDLLPPSLHRSLLFDLDVENDEQMLQLMERIRPDVVLNCIGLVKQISESHLAQSAIRINSLLPHRLADFCRLFDARLIQISTDCVFSGRVGMYSESDFADADDLYGRSKYLGEVDYPHALTLRTSIIGHELNGSRSLLNWFLAQDGPVMGFERAIFSGLPTVELGKIILHHVLPNEGLSGIYHLSAEPISKFDLLTLISRHYEKHIDILPQQDFIINRSLNSDRFRRATNFYPKTWNEMIESMKNFG